MVDEKITLVEKKSQFQSNKKKEPASLQRKNLQIKTTLFECILEKWEELNLSREGEIAIAKRIEAGKDVMINALTQSPLVGKKYLNGESKLKANSY